MVILSTAKVEICGASHRAQKTSEIWINRLRKTLSMKGTGFSPYIKELRTMGFSP
jgi:hypothetical protein